MFFFYQSIMLFLSGLRTHCLALNNRDFLMFSQILQWFFLNEFLYKMLGLNQGCSLSPSPFSLPPISTPSPWMSNCLSTILLKKWLSFLYLIISHHCHNSVEHSCVVHVFILYCIPLIYVSILISILQYLKYCSHKLSFNIANRIIIYILLIFMII
jgi:hypothetical protein